MYAKSKQNREGYQNTMDTAGVALVCQTHFTHILLKIDIFTSPLWVLMGHRYLEGGQPKKQNWLPKGQITKKLSVGTLHSLCFLTHTLSCLL